MLVSNIRHNLLPHFKGDIIIDVEKVARPYFFPFIAKTQKTLFA